MRLARNALISLGFIVMAAVVLQVSGFNDYIMEMARKPKVVIMNPTRERPNVYAGSGLEGYRWYRQWRQVGKAPCYPTNLRFSSYKLCHLSGQRWIERGNLRKFWCVPDGFKPGGQKITCEDLKVLERGGKK